MMMVVVMMMLVIGLKFNILLFISMKRELELI